MGRHGKDYVVRDGDGLRLVETAADLPEAFGRMCAFHGQMGMFTRALAYILMIGKLERVE